jgi:hypothetical protein
MAIISELEEHIGNSSPAMAHFLAKTANTMSEAQQRDFLASLQMMDIEFQMEVAPYMPEGSEIDPSVARLMTFPPEAGVGPGGLNIAGVSSEGIYNPDTLNIPYGEHSIQLEPDTVSAIEPINARAPLWAHEYRHFEDPQPPEMWGSKDVNNHELVNRVQDLMASQNKDELAANVQSLAGLAFERARKDNAVSRRILGTQGQPLRVDALFPDEETFLDALRAPRFGTDVTIARAARKLLGSPLLSKLISGPGKGLPDAAIGPYYKRVVLGDIEMPEDYREGGRTRLI